MSARIHRRNKLNVAWRRDLCAVGIALVGVVGMSAAPAAAAPGGECCRQLVVNGGFQRGAGDLPFAWTPDPYRPTASLVWDRHIGHHGHRSVRISDVNPTDSRWDQDVAVRPNTEYRLDGWIRTEDVRPGTEPMQFGANLSVLNTKDVTFDHSEPVLFGTHDWTYVSMQFNTEAATQVTVAARLGFFSGTASGTAWFDDIRLRPASCPTIPGHHS